MGKYRKYGRTMNLPWSQSNSSDDVWLASTKHFEGKTIILSEKYDGENTTLYNNYIHARSIDSALTHHTSRSPVKRIHASIKYLIPEGYRVCGENVYAKHSIRYEALTSYFYIFAIFDAEGTCLSWLDTCQWADILGLPTVPVLYQGPWDEVIIKSFWPIPSTLGAPEAEGYVVRLADAFPEMEFKKSCAKFVRPNHCQTTVHWMKSWKPNKLLERTLVNG